MTSIALLGAGGKMGSRVTAHLQDHPDYDLRCVESGERGVASLVSRGVKPMPMAEALREVEIVLFAVPDRRLGEVAREVVPRLKPGCLLVTLDPAAAQAGELPPRPDISYFITHPCHPGLFTHQPDAETTSIFSEGARLIIEYGRDRLLRPDWKRVFEPAQLAEQVHAIVRGQAPALCD
jgi:hypothetical protein